MMQQLRPYQLDLSLPTRERGLKYGVAHDDKTLSEVAPYTGAWIEIPLYQIGTLR